MNVASCFGDDIGRRAEVGQQVQNAESSAHNDGGADRGNPKALSEDVGTLLTMAAAKGLSNQGFKAVEEKDGAKSQRVEDGITERRGGDGEGGVRQMADHGGIDQIRGHPSQFAQR